MSAGRGGRDAAGEGGDPGTPLDVSTGLGRTIGGAAGGAAPADAAATGLGTGAVLGGRYEVRARLGVGGMGAVYRVLDRKRGVEVALKVMLPSLMALPKAVERFKEEAEVLLRLAHEGIVRVFDVNDDPERGVRFYTMELLGSPHDIAAPPARLVPSPETGGKARAGRSGRGSMSSARRARRSPRPMRSRSRGRSSRRSAAPTS